MSRKSEGGAGKPAEELDAELQRRLRDIEKEEVPERLLVLARKLQELLRARNAGN